jgi:hypothetical protein
MSRKLTEIKVSDHALIRYIERILGENLDPIRQLILTDELTFKVKSLKGTGTFVFHDHTAIVRQGTVTTILAPDQLSKGTIRKRRYKNEKSKKIQTT